MSKTYPTSIEILTGLPLIQQVYAFGLDGMTPRIRPPYPSNPLELNRETFLRELYCSRPTHERFLMSHLNLSKPLWIQGPIGCGKTTLAHRVVWDYCTRYRLPEVILDLKPHFDAATSPVSDTNDARSSSDNESDGLIRWLDSLLARTCDAAFASPSIPPARDLLMTFFKYPGAQIIRNNRGVEALRRLQDCYSYSNSARTQKDFAAWIAFIGIGDTNDPADTHAKQSLLDLTYSLAPYERLALISLHQNGEVHRTPVLIDNLDVAKSRSLRTTFAAWLEAQAGEYKDLVQFILCVRPENIGSFSVNDAPLPTQSASFDGSDGDFEFFDDATRYRFVFDVYPGEIEKDVVDQYDRQLNRRAAIDPAIDERPIASSRDHRRCAFDMRIHKKRAEYLRKRIEENRGVDANQPVPGAEALWHNVDAAAKAAEELMDTSSIADDLARLSNGNRKDMLADIGNLLEYAVRDLCLEWSKIGCLDLRSGQVVSGARTVALKSLYYKWLASRNGPEAAKQFALVKWVNGAGWKGAVLEDQTNLMASSITESLAPLYLLLCLYNLCGNSVEDKRHESVVVQGVIDRCRKLLLSEAMVCELLTDMIRRASPTDHGLIEGDGFLAIHRGKREVRPSDKIAISEAGCTLLENTSSMFNFIGELLSDEKSFVKEVFERGGVSHALANGVLRFLQRAVTTEVRVMSILANGQNPSHEAFEAYYQLFSVKRRLRTRTTGERWLWSHRAIKLAHAHLQSTVELSQDGTSLIASVRDELERMDGFISNQVTREGKWDLIPRNQPFIVRKGA